MVSSRACVIVVTLLKLISACPTSDSLDARENLGTEVKRDDNGNRDNDNDNVYLPPGSHDSRAPCPGLNTLANHEFIPRDGRQVSAGQIVWGFWAGFGMDKSTIQVALENAFTVCEYVTGSNCNGVLPNLTILAEPHTFEHDHSLSREDYRMAYADGGETDNYNFNSSVFQSVLNTIGGQTRVDYSLANEIRLVRMSMALVLDYPGWFQQSVPTQAQEIGFIFAAMSDPKLPEPQVVTEWWHYWFENESFPWDLGWRKPNPPRNNDFVLSVASAVLEAPVTSTPSPLLPGWIHPRDTTPDVLPNAPTVPILPLPTETPYVAPDALALEHDGGPNKRQVVGAYGVAATQVAAAVSAAANELVMPNPYADVISLEQMNQMRAIGDARLSSTQAARNTSA